MRIYHRSIIDVYFDITKAFDTVDHTLLVNKLRRFGLNGNILKWFIDYLSGRQQRVLLNGEISKTLSVSSGVLQIKDQYLVHYCS